MRKSGSDEADRLPAHPPDRVSPVVSEAGGKPMSICVQLLNDRGETTAVITVDDRDEEWLGAVGLFNSADRKVRKLGRTMRRAMEGLGKQRAIGLEASTS